MMTALTSVAAASGTRSWLAHKKPRWLTPRGFRYITVGLLAFAVLAAGTLSGTGS
jgi:hypothetical protein